MQAGASSDPSVPERPPSGERTATRGKSLTREEAEAALREVGLNPERIGDEEWEIAVRETMGETVRGSRSPTLTPSSRLRSLSDELQTLSPTLVARIEEAKANPPPPPEVDCATCGDARFIRMRPLDREGGRGYHLDDAMPLAIARNVEPCPSCSQVWTEEQLAQHRVPARRLGWTFDKFVPLPGKSEAKDEALMWAFRVAADPYTAGHLLLWGATPGVGKTHLAIAAVLYCIGEGRRAVLWPLQDLLRELQSRFGDGAAVRAFEDQLRRVPVLVLDDLGAEMRSGSGWSTDVIESLIEARTAEERPTLITTNLPPAELAKHVEARAASRLKLFRWVEVGGQDMRGSR